MDSNKQSLRSEDLKQSLPSEDGNPAAPQAPAANITSPQPGASLESVISPQLPAAPAQSSAPQAPDSGESNKMVLMLIIGLVVILALVGGIYLFLNKQQAANSESQAVVIQTPLPAPQENLEEDLNSIDLDAETDSDFAQIDQDLQQL